MRLSSILLASCCLSATMATPAIAAVAQDSRYPVSLPAQSLDASLMQISRSMGLQLVYTDAALRGVRAPALRGTMTARQALDRLLRGTGYAYRFVNANTVRVLRAGQADAIRTVSKTPVAYGLPVQEAGSDVQSLPSAGDQEVDPAGEVTVTGSRIARDSIDTPTPVVTMTREEFEESGGTELSEVLADLPAVSSGLNDATVGGNVQNSGLSAIQLRNLGDNRTLVLIDGRRTVSNSANANRVSTSTIPSSFVDRVEIITGGTSSVYGSDAVAGVVNIITTDHRGIRLSARGGITEHGDGKELTLEGLWGTRFADQRGYFAISGTYDRDYGINASDREWASRQVDYRYVDGRNLFQTLYTDENGVLTSGTQPAATFPPNEFRDLSSSTPGGVFYAANSAQDRFYDADGLVPLGPNTQNGGVVRPGTRDDGNTGYFLANRDGYNQREFRSLILPRERYLAAAKFDYKLSDATSFFAQVQFSRVNSRERREPVGLGFDSTVTVFDAVTGTQRDETIGRIPCRRSDLGPCNPFVPYQVFANNLTSSTQGIAWNRRFNEVGYRDTTNRRDTIRSWAGFRGQAWGDWTWEASIGYGVYQQEQFRQNEINGIALRNALDAEEVGGEIRCRSAQARADGCVPINLFGEGSITSQAADYIRADLRQEVTIKQETFQGFMTGSLFDLPAGPVRAAYGIDYRKDTQRLRGDILSNIGGTTGNAVPDFGGSIAAFEGFAEVSVPLIRDQTFFRLLSFDASARIAEYDIRNVGTVFSYRAGLQWAPISDIRFRGQFARAQRAPDIAELFSPPRGDSDNVRDICTGVTPTTAGRIANRCRDEPGIQAHFLNDFENGNIVSYDQSGSTVYSPNGGNLNLKEETADTITLGAVFQPSFVPGLTVAVDYYDIDVRDAITAYGNEDILSECYDSDLALADNSFCADIRRNPNNGQITALTQRQFNVASLETSGIDVSVQYRFDLESAIGIPGRWDVRYEGTHVLKQESRFHGLEGLVVSDQLGYLSSGGFEYRARGSVSWRHDSLRLRYTVKYLSPTIDSRARLEAYEQELERNPAAEYPLFLKIPAVWEHDVYAAYELNMESNDLRIYGGVKNLFDRVSPFLPTGVDSGRLTNQNSSFDVAGRRFYLGAVLEF